MKKKLRLNILRSVTLLLVIVLSIGACKKDDDDDNGSNGYDGQITFYTNSSDCGSIQIELNDENVGPLTTVYSGTSAPTCGSDSTLTIDVNIGVHDYYAEDSCNNIWTGSIIINKGDCKVKLLGQ